MSVTLIEVAKAAGVGTTTASVILNSPHEAGRFREATREKVKKVARDMGYHPNHRARSFRGGRTQILGLALEYHGVGDSPIMETYSSELAAGLQAGLWKSGYNLLLVTATREQSAASLGIDFIRQGRIDGLFLIHSPTDEDMIKVQEESSRVVLVNRRRIPGISAVYADDRKGVDLAVKYLVDKGHRRLAWLAPQEFFDRSSERRSDAFAATCMGCGVNGTFARFSPEKDMTDYLQPGGFSNLAREMALESLNQPDRPTAVLCFNLECATGLYQAAASLGLSIPEDLSVVSFETAWASRFMPPVDAVNLRWAQHGQIAAQMLVDSLESKEGISFRHEVVEPELVPAQSTAPPPGSP